jgi:hypothetical protein
MIGMTLIQYLHEDQPFYHITKTSNLPSIYQQGLRAQNPFGICVVRSRDPLVIKFIVEMMLFVDDEVDFTILEIRPSQFNLKVSEIIDDHVVEETNCLHNYIRRPRLTITHANIVDSYIASRQGIPDKKELVNEITSRKLLWSFQ